MFDYRVEYFGEKMSGICFTVNGWVQSYGSRCTRPPVIYGDVTRPAAMTVEEFKWAQSLTSKPVKGMLTGWYFTGGCIRYCLLRMIVLNLRFAPYHLNLYVLSSPGPVTILNWSFPRKDVSRSYQAFQIGLALREEVKDLEAAGCRVIQVDEPAIREGLPLKNERWPGYLEWAVNAFR